MARDRSEDARTGWKSRRARDRDSRRRHSPEEREAIRAARASLQANEEHGFNPEVRPAQPGEGDYVSQLSDADLVALYRQLHDGRAPNGKAKRPAIERAVRAKQAEQAAQQPEPTVGDDSTELTLDQLVDDEQIESDDQ
jgi:hypothetical protein